MQKMAEVIKCKAAVCWGPKQPLEIQTIQVDPPNAMEVRIKIICTSLCNVDLTFWKCLSDNPSSYPRIFGHERSGIVESVGRGVKDLKKGDHVIPLFNGECGECNSCLSPDTNMCKNFKLDSGRSVMRSDGKPRFSIQGKPIYHFFTSTFSEFTVVDSRCVTKINEDIPFEKATLCGCGLTAGVGAALCTCNVKKDSSVVVIGLGGVGLAIILENLEGGADYCFECTGNMEILYEAFLATKEAVGTTAMMGFDLTGHKISLDPLEVMSRRKLVSAVFGGIKGKT